MQSSSIPPKVDQADQSRRTEERQTLRIPSSVGVPFGRIKQSQEYLEIGETLTAMVEIEEDGEWRIDESVYATASRVAVELMADSYPAPRIFSHGSKSVVFNWTSETNNLYLTISSNKISALLSSPEQIEARIDYSVNQLQNPALFLSSIQPGRWGQSIALINATSDSLDAFG
jgi:hypothetical protein